MTTLFAGRETRPVRFALWGAAWLLLLVFYAGPLLLIVLASFAGQWNGALPSHLTWRHYGQALTGDQAGSLWASLATGMIASTAALALGTTAALALRGARPAWQRIGSLAFYLPSAVPTVSVGLGLLVAYSRRPVLLNGTVAIVVLAHLAIVSAFAFGAVQAGLARLPPEYEDVAAGLGARRFYLLRRVTLPLLAPYLGAAFNLAFALSMGELAATIMVYPPGWVTMPISIFALTDRGDTFEGAALTVILAAATLLVLGGVARVVARAGGRARKDRRAR
ncbi:MAG: ABC transporter permease subunit [Rhodospirillales bacterium]|nr:ABC transporter permease subunit [Rhodospirillales bacterium]